MPQIVYKKGSVFEATEGVIVHSCNAMGVWGAGVALEMRRRFYMAFLEYKQHCRGKPSAMTLGTVCVTPAGARHPNLHIASLIVSKGYGAYKDAPGVILRNTQKALDVLLQHWSYRGVAMPRTFHSPRINAGLFDVPWLSTEYEIQQALKPYPEVTWTVWTP